VEHRDHFFNIVEDFQHVDISRRLESIATLFCPSRMFEIMSSSLEHCRVNWACVTMAR
jgi:hypothetical protein